MKAFLSSCHFLVLLFPAVTALLCFHRDFVDVTKNIDCLINGVCIVRVTMNHLNVALESSYEIECAKNCPYTNYTFTTIGGFFLISTIFCCEVDLCDSYDFEWPKPGPYNGRQCEACRASVSEGCSDLNTTRCRGDETQCISFVIVHNDSSVPDEVYKGCASPSFCDLARKSPYNKYFSGTITESRCCETLRSSEQLNFEE